MAAPPAEASPAQLAERLLGLTRRLRRASAQDLAPLGLTPWQARALRAVGHSERPLRLSELAATMDMVPRSATTVVDALETAGLVRRADDPGDRRSTLVTLTEAGEEKLTALRRARRAVAEELFETLTAADRDELLRLLAALEAALPECECRG
jgi:DNA-binding MarR family transcriptional regulator